MGMLEMITREKNRKTDITLEEGDAALVIDKRGQISFYMPDSADDEAVPDHVIYLCAIATFTKDEEFVADVLDRFDEAVEMIDED